jgi:hypothetical protein
VSESGDQIRPRNSHSLAVLQHGDCAYLVLFGGAEPDDGPLNDMYISPLPAIVTGACY